MSLTKIKQKETKGKKNVLPKLRTVLANPYKHHSPVLPESEVEQFCRILEEAKTRSENSGGHSGKSFVSRSHINLGLASCLRVIHSQRFSCVFISLSLRPAHLVRLIATSAAVKMPTAGIFAQPKLEDLTYKLFGVRSMALALPLELKTISEDLDKWVNSHKKLAPATHNVPSLKKRKIKEKVPMKPTLEIPTNLIEELKPTPHETKDSWSGDYISCSKIETLNRKDTQVEAQQLGAALNNLAMKAKAKPVNIPESKDSEETPQEPMEVELEVSGTQHEDEFLATDLSTYRPLTINVLRPNPGKKPKKKRNKKPASKTK